VREYVEDREVSAWFLLDLSASVDFGSSAKRKRAVSQDFVTVLARLLTRHGNRVGAILYGDRVDTVIPARGGRRQVLHLLHRMSTRPDGRALEGHAPRRPSDARAVDRAAPLAHVRRVRLHQRAGLGQGARPPRASATRRSPCACTTRSSACCPTSAW
jgi:uncharacterized protein (DUF58 family)